MKIAFVGKGGSGKTTLASLFARHLAAAGRPIVAVDADINQHLGTALGLTAREAAAVPPLGARLTEIKEFLRGDNPRISSAAAMVKTTPPGRGSRLLRPGGDDPFHREWSLDAGGVRLMVTGPFAEDDLGVACYHSKVGAVELYLNHLVDGPGDYAVVHMTAGADSFASGLFTRFDLTFLVVEPTLKSVGVLRQYEAYARDFDVRPAVVGNKVQGPGDVEFLREQVGGALLVCLEWSGHVRAREQGRSGGPLEQANHTALDRMREAVDATPQDWDRFTRQAVEFHLKNARSWANRAVGEDLSEQIDPAFALGPAALADASR